MRALSQTDALSVRSGGADRARPAIGITASLRDVDFTSVWCVYAALVSVLILEHFRRERAGDSGARPRAPVATAP
jgi:hypothetical protein